MDKMKGTYCDGLLKAELDGVVHPTINECVTATGRYSSKNPNSQNIPREGTSGVKKFFITRYT
jgi:DNA polymerase I-like protein with 3'-5' exonuclease and polymerase domains